jgi:hypothetical protein
MTKIPNLGMTMPNMGTKKSTIARAHAVATAKRRKNGTSDEFSRAVGRALRRAARRAREIARMHGTAIYVVKNGKIVAIKP